LPQRGRRDTVGHVVIIIIEKDSEQAAMPKGGRREGAGRKPGIPNRRHQVTAADIGHDGYMPIEYMLSLMRDERAEANRRDAMAIQAAAYLHPRLAAVATSNANGNGPNGDVNIVQIFAVPRGARVDVKDGSVITIDGESTELSSIEPYQPTPGLDAMPQLPPPVEQDVLKVEPISEPEPDNITPLSAWRRRDEP
jgi:hypothetical protein